MASKVIWTIGHSTHPLDAFIGMLQNFEIELLADVRRFPMSRRYPHFNKDNLQPALGSVGINYQHFVDLGGRRNPKLDSQNNGWRVAAFRGYADYMQTPDFQTDIAELEKLARQQRTAIMCSEAVWWSCHRSLISDFFKHKGWTVLHILGKEKADEHPYTSPARIENNTLHYRKDNPLGF